MKMRFVRIADLVIQIPQKAFSNVEDILQKKPKEIMQNSPLCIGMIFAENLKNRKYKPRYLKLAKIA